MKIRTTILFLLPGVCFSNGFVQKSDSAAWEKFDDEGNALSEMRVFNKN